jgi:hypothetical protein
MQISLLAQANATYQIAALSDFRGSCALEEMEVGNPYLSAPFWQADDVSRAMESSLWW